MGKYILMGSYGLPEESSSKGRYGGHRKLKIFGTLDCPSAAKWIEKGEYTKHRVFFKDEATSIAAGYRPCAVCMKKEHAKWKLLSKGLISPIEVVDLWEKGNATDIASIMIGGEVQTPKWSCLKRYWPYATAEHVEYMAVSIINPYVVFSMTCAQGQGGIIAVWDIANRKWAQVSEASYVAISLLYQPLDVIISLHYVTNAWATARLEIYLTPLDFSKDISIDRGIKLTAVTENMGFDPEAHPVALAATVRYKANQYGPLGIYVDAEASTFYAHDCGNLFTFSTDDILKALQGKVKA